MTRIGEIESERKMWFSPDTTLEEKNESFFRLANLLELDMTFNEISMTGKKNKYWNTRGIKNVLGTVFQEAHHYCMQEIFGDENAEQFKEENGRDYSLTLPYNYDYKKPFATQIETTHSYDLEVRYDNGRLKLRAPLDEIIEYSTETRSERDATEDKKNAILGFMDYINYKGNADFVSNEHVEVSRVRDDIFPSGRSNRKGLTKVVLTGKGFGYGDGCMEFEEDKTPFVNDRLHVSIHIYPPSVNDMGEEIDQEFDIVSARSRKKDIWSVSNYGMEITIRGKHDKQLSTEEFDFYFKELLLDAYADMEKQFRKYYNMHANIVKNFFAKILGIKRGELPQEFKDFYLKFKWAGFSPCRCDGEFATDFTLSVDKLKEFHSSYWWNDYKMRHDTQRDEGIHRAASLYLDFFEKVDNMFPMIGRKTVLSCGNFVEGVTGQSCDLSLMQKINA